MESLKPVWIAVGTGLAALAGQYGIVTRPALDDVQAEVQASETLSAELQKCYERLDVCYQRCENP